jgi:hypothetical protein
MSEVFTTTLASGATLVITPTVDSGEVLLIQILLAGLALLLLEFTFRLVYRR